MTKGNIDQYKGIKISQIECMKAEEFLTFTINMYLRYGF